ncbi:MAG: nuclear transport factor 2 family protein [Fimbriimonadaceae bacterium]|nr:nuclear transport factor 2 family protein [Fimbriimonadaceae bacterium]
MSVSPIQRQKIQDVFDAMEAGVAGEAKILGAFTQDAVMIEPFSGEGVPAKVEGLDAIRGWFMHSAEGGGPQDLKLTIDRIDIAGDGFRVDWTCDSASFPTKMEGHDIFKFDGDRVNYFEIVVTKWPGH